MVETTIILYGIECPTTKQSFFVFVLDLILVKKIQYIKKYVPKHKILKLFLKIFFKNLKKADCDALLQGFVNEIQSSILFYL